MWLTSWGVGRPVLYFWIIICIIRWSIVRWTYLNKNSHTMLSWRESFATLLSWMLGSQRKWILLLVTYSSIIIAMILHVKLQIILHVKFRCSFNSTDYSYFSCRLKPWQNHVLGEFHAFAFARRARILLSIHTHWLNVAPIIHYCNYIASIHVAHLVKI